jgi:hypothetical protein
LNAGHQRSRPVLRISGAGMEEFDLLSRIDGVLAEIAYFPSGEVRVEAIEAQRSDRPGRRRPSPWHQARPRPPPSASPPPRPAPQGGSARR